MTDKGTGTDDWSEIAKGIIKGELKRHNMTYADLVAALERVGVRETEPNLRNKISRGNFSASFMIQCLRAIGVDILVLNQARGRRSFPGVTAKIAPGGRDLDEPD